MKIRNRILLPVLMILIIAIAIISTLNYQITKNAITQQFDMEMETGITNINIQAEHSERVLDLVMREMD